MKSVILSLIVLIFSVVSVSAALDPTLAYCKDQDYDVIRILSADYEGNYVEKWQYFDLGISKADLKFNGDFYEMDTTKRETLELNRIVLGRESTMGNINWNINGTYCRFDDDVMCTLKSFYEGSCGQKYKKDISCRQEGEALFPFETCCDGLESSIHSWGTQPPGQSICIKKLNFFQKLWQWIF